MTIEQCQARINYLMEILRDQVSDNEQATDTLNDLEYTFEDLETAKQKESEGVSQRGKSKVA